MKPDKETQFRKHFCKDCGHFGSYGRCLLPDSEWCGLQDWKDVARASEKYNDELAVAFAKKIEDILTGKSKRKGKRHA